ncbi:hypothetical protein [Vibrio barjaei]|nr:hypothetical protein [Vibrio barjaei]MCY9874788.1 hypothetical protein [Vibrio barjaei]
MELSKELNVCISNVNALFNGRANSVKGWSITEANKRAGYNGL